MNSRTCLLTDISIQTKTSRIIDVTININKGIVFTCRVHPGESNSSFIIEGIIEFLLSNSREAIFLRNNYVFKILPMINPDGVIYGNYRCSLLGVDLNRRWNDPSKILHPTIYNAKQLVKMIDIERSVAMFCDIHGHSRKKNIFMYGCCMNNLEVNSTKVNETIKLLPYMVNDKNKIFSYKDCTFALEKEKENTARIVIFKEIGVTNWYTLESTFYGSDALAKVVYEEESSDEEDEEQENETNELTTDSKQSNNFDSETKIGSIKPFNEQDDDTNDKPVNIQDISGDISINDIKDIKLPSVQRYSENKEEEKDEKEANSENTNKEDEKDNTSPTENKSKPARKQRLVGDIHINIQHLKDFGADLCRTMFSFFNESIKVRKLNHLRKLSKCEWFNIFRNKIQQD